MLDTLDGIKRALSTTLNNTSLFSLINTRLMLRTGVDLAAIKPTENRNPASVSKVMGALQAMGYQLNNADPKARS
jgi:hypothetical protein